LDLQGELDKMGLTNSSKHTKQQSLTSVLYQDWNSTERATTTTRVDKKQWAILQERNMDFLSDELVSDFSYETPLSNAASMMALLLLESIESIF
jgi:hypothetical protein